MRTSDFDYVLPPELIAREPARPRDSSRMMLLDRKTGRYTDSYFRNLPEFLNPSDVLVTSHSSLADLNHILAVGAQVDKNSFR